MVQVSWQRLSLSREGTGVSQSPTDETKARVARVLGKTWGELDVDDRRNIVGRCSLRLSRAAGISIAESRAVIALLRRSRV